MRAIVAPHATLSLRDAIAALNEHYSANILPIWRQIGFNRDLGLPFEALSSVNGSPLPPTRYRAMACARQLFIFSLAGDLTHAKRLFDSLCHYFEDKKHGGWFYSVDANGMPQECQKDLYTHAFVIFAAAHYALCTGDPAALSVVQRTNASIERFAIAHKGSYCAVMAENFSYAQKGLLQNPLMHLTEAWLAARAATNDTSFDDLLAQLVATVQTTFIVPQSGCIAELPWGSADNRLEPGHQFEWYYLVYESRHPALEPLKTSLARAFSFAASYGVDTKTGGVYASLDEKGQIVDSAQRIWAQTEYLRALAAHTEESVRSTLPGQIEHFRTRFLHPRGWFECLTPDGTLVRDDMPSTTPYHIATAFSTLLSAQAKT